MPPPLSAGILLFRVREELAVLLAKPGGPFWRTKDAGAWMIPKGMVEPGEAPVEAALREFEEETGAKLAAIPFRLCTVRQAGGKIVEVFAAEGDFDPAGLTSVEFELQWPPRSGQVQRFPEVAEARWMTVALARELMLPSQLPMLDALEEKLRG
jgi:predicted NUDIX family NTP pyrophosphohydrolase